MENRVEKYTLVVEENDQNLRLDQYIANILGKTRSFIKNNVKNVLINGKKTKFSKIPVKGDKIEIEILYEKIPESIIPQSSNLDIIFEDSYYLIIRKMAGIPVHPSYGHYKDTLVNYVVSYLMEKGIYLKDSGIVHRLDMDTEGIIIFAKSEDAQLKIRKLFKERKIDKYYFVIVKGEIKKKYGVLENYMKRDERNRLRYKAIKEKAGNSRYAKLYYKVLKVFKTKFTLLNVKLYTGRTHQIRVQFSSIGHPVLGDRIYSRNYKQFFKKYGLLLLSYRIKFLHPFTNKIIDVRISLPERFKMFIKENS